MIEEQKEHPKRSGRPYKKKKRYHGRGKECLDRELKTERGRMIRGELTKSRIRADEERGEDVKPKRTHFHWKTARRSSIYGTACLQEGAAGAEKGEKNLERVFISGTHLEGDAAFCGSEIAEYTHQSKAHGHIRRRGEGRV